MADPADRALFAERLRALRGTRTQREVATLIGAKIGKLLTPQALGHWENGTHSPRDAQTVWAIEEVLGAQPGELAEPLGFAAHSPAAFLGSAAEEIASQVAALRDGQAALAEAVERIESMVEDLHRRRAGPE